MKLKILTLIFCFSVNFSQSTIAAVAVKGEEHKTISSSRTKKISKIKSHKKWKWFQKKRKLKKRKFRLFNFSKWKKKKTKKRKKIEEGDNRNYDVIAVLSFIFTLFGTVFFLFSPFGFSLIFTLILVFFGGLFGIGGLTRIRQNPDEKKGEVLTIVGIMGLAVLALVLLEIQLLRMLDFF